MHPDEGPAYLHPQLKRAFDFLPPNQEEDRMRVIDCPCGHRLEGVDNEDLFEQAREHVDRDHPGMERTDEEIRARIVADAYDSDEG